VRFEVVDSVITWLKTNSKEVIEMSVEKKGSNKAYSYTQKTTTLVGGEKQFKKKCISSQEYVEIR
jgi:hypothetical protein